MAYELNKSTGTPRIQDSTASTPPPDNPSTTIFRAFPFCSNCANNIAKRSQAEMEAQKSKQELLFVQQQRDSHQLQINTLYDHIDQINSEYNKLLAEGREEDHKEIQRLRDANSALKIQVSNLETALKDSILKIEKLEADNLARDALIAELKKDNVELKKENAELKKELGDVKDTLSSLTGSLDLRECLRSLEDYVVRDVVGSKAQMIKQGKYDYEDLSTDEKKQYTLVLPDEERRLLKLAIKRGSNIHHRLPLTKSQMADIWIDTDDDDDGVKVMKQKMIDMLDTYCTNQGKPFGVSLFKQ